MEYKTLEAICELTRNLHNITIHPKTCPCKLTSCDAIRQNNLTALQFMHKLDCIYDTEFISYGDLCNDVAMYGHLEILKWAKDVEVPNSGKIFNGQKILAIAALKGHTEIVKWCLELGIKPNDKALKNAVKSDKLEIVEMLLTQKCMPNYSLSV